MAVSISNFGLFDINAGAEVQCTIASSRGNMSSKLILSSPVAVGEVAVVGNVSVRSPHRVCKRHVFLCACVLVLKVIGGEMLLLLLLCTLRTLIPLVTVLSLTSTWSSGSLTSLYPPCCEHTRHCYPTSGPLEATITTRRIHRHSRSSWCWSSLQPQHVGA